ncbi:MAG: AraC family transcriptional regulator [Candidatus Borkfalkiaceae bacterium]|nr:AraC family transcriptional regulator [Clostridia bacterium]MDY6223041.1 AraC family transcriptional regulator [Christensenellaceae bacterium]
MKTTRSATASPVAHDSREQKNAAPARKKCASKRFFMRKIDNLINVQKIVTVHYQELEKGYAAPEEKHDFWEMVYTDKGNAFVVTDGTSYLLKRGETFFIPPNLPHYVCSGNNEPNVFIISFSCRSESIRFFSNRAFPVPENLSYLLENILAEARETFVLPDFDPDLKKLELRENANIGGEQVIKNSLELLLIYLLRRGENQVSPQEFFVSKIASSTALQDEIVRYLSERVYGTFSLEELCGEIHYGKTHLCTFFKKQTGKTIYQTYLKLKTDEAKKLIRRKTSFSEIAERLGFDSLSHFNYVFKNYAGMTPGEYKKSIK